MVAHIEKIEVKGKEQSLSEILPFSVSQSFMYFIEAWNGYGIFSGRASRNMFWSFFFFNLIIGTLVALGAGRQGASVYYVISFFPAWAVMVRRLHDVGQSGIWSVMPSALTFASGFFIQTELYVLVSLCWMFSLIFSVLLVFFLCLKSDGDNKYGAAVTQ